MLSVLHRSTDYGYPFSILKSFLCYPCFVLSTPLEYNGDVIFSMIASSVVSLRRKSKYWFSGSHNEESEWSNIPTVGLLDTNMLS